jgi:biotin operon repressor
MGFVLLIDGLTASPLAATLFGRLRDEVLALPLTWVVAVRDADEGTILRPPADTFFARVIRLGPLTPEDAYSLAAARAGESLPPGLLAEVVQRTQLQPRSVIRLLQGLVFDGVNPSEALATADERRTRLAPLSAAAQRLYALLDSRGPASASDPVLQTELGLTRGRVTNLLHDLEKAGLVVASEVRTGPGRPRKAYRVLT